jgi:hypothetical protein
MTTLAPPGESIVDEREHNVDLLAAGPPGLLLSSARSIWPSSHFG